MRRIRLSLWTLLFVPSIFCACSASADGTIFFGAQGHVYRSIITDKKPSAKEELNFQLPADYTGDFGPFVTSSTVALAVDSQEKKLYLVDTTGSSGVFVSDFDGANSSLIGTTLSEERDVQATVSTPRSVALDESLKILIVCIDDPTTTANQIDSKIITVGVDGTNLQTLTAGDTIEAQFIVFDSTTSILYWSVPNRALIRFGTVDTANATLSGLGDFYAGNVVQNEPEALVLDTKNGFLYWVDAQRSNTDRGIYRKSLSDVDVKDTSTVTALYLTSDSGSDPIDIGLGYGIALDVKAGQVYWSDTTTDLLQSPQRFQRIWAGNVGGVSTASPSVLFESDAALQDIALPTGISFAPPRTVTPDITPDPAEVTVSGRDVTIVFEDFRRALLSLGQQPDVTGALAARRRVTFKYKAILERTNDSAGNPVTNDIRRETTKRNSLTLTDLTPGTYTVKYRVVFRRKSRVIDRGNFSPAAGFVIPE